MRNKFLITIILLFFSVSNNAQSTNDYKPTLDKIFKAFKEKNYDLLKPLLDPNMKIGDFPAGMNDAIIPQILSQMPIPETYSVKEMIKEGENMRINTIYTFGMMPEMKRSFVFNKQGKIVDFDVLSEVVVKKQTVSNVGKPSESARFELPFELKNGIIYVKASLNGKEETFILDSGAPVLILNSDSKSVKNVSKVEKRSNGIGGKINNTGSTHIDTFSWGAIKVTDADIITMPLNHLDGGKTPFVGLIGYDLFKDYQLTFDYQSKKITGVLSNDTSKQVDNNEELLTTIPFELKMHIPVFKVEIGGKEYKVGLDTGASHNLLYAKYLNELEIKKMVEGGEDATIKGAAGSVNGKAGKIKMLTAGNVEYKNMNFAFEDSALDQLNAGYGLGIDGLLGYEFLKSYIVTIDFKAKVIRVYNKKV